MDTKTFLSRVSASVDELLICALKPDPSGDKSKDIFWNRGSFTDLDEATTAIQRWDNSADWTIYFAVGRMADHSYTKPDGKTAYRRKKDHATMFKALCFDMDIGGTHKYATKRDGHVALTAAIQAIGLPSPMVVDSGGGIHYYWPLTQPISKLHWEKASFALRLALAEHKVEIDTSKIHDASMVLRPVGTHNKKQHPWREVKLMADCPDYDPVLVISPLKPWLGKMPAQAVAKRPLSGMMGAVLVNRNVVLDVVGRKCQQIGALLRSAGEFDAMGQHVAEPVWRGSLGFANFCTDPEEAVMRLSSGHQDYDHDANMEKMSRWTGGPPTCAYFEQHCPGGCGGCAYKGSIKSPVNLNEEPVAPPPAVLSGKADPEIPFALPPGYYLDNGKIVIEEELEEQVMDDEGKKTGKTKTIITRSLVCPYEMHILAMYTDLMSTSTTVSIAIKYPMGEWKTHEMPVTDLSSGGKEFVAYLANKQVILSPDALYIKTRTFLMRYLAMVQQKMATGVDFKRFGWQEDGSFLCGSQLVGAPTGNTLRRLRGAAASFESVLCHKGSREVWAETTRLVDTPHAEFLGVSILSACMGALGNVAGAGTLLFSFYSADTGTGKTLSLLMGNSVAGDPVKMLRNPKDTDNALYKVFGTLGDISCSIDEITSISPERAVDLAYSVSMGSEKLSLTKDRDIREAETWASPTRVSTNTSLYYLFESSMAQNDPVRYRTMQFELNDRTFVNGYGTDLYHTVTQNYGFAMPELAQAIIDMGGKRAVWEAAVPQFEKKFRFTFESQERFYRTACITCWVLGKLGKKLGLFRFDVDRVIRYMLSRVAELRTTVATDKSDAFDTIGQFIQEHNHALIVTKELYGSRKVEVQPPVPDNACVRLEVVHDSANPVLPGSKLYINATAIKHWLKSSKDNLERLTNELQGLGGLISERERYSLYKGCHRVNPGQAYCIVLDATHPRMATVISGGKPVSVNSTAPARAVLVGVAP